MTFILWKKSQNLGHKSACSCRMQITTLVTSVFTVTAFLFRGEIASSVAGSSQAPAACYVNAVIMFVDGSAVRVHYVRTAIIRIDLCVFGWDFYNYRSQTVKSKCRCRNAASTQAWSSEETLVTSHCYETNMHNCTSHERQWRYMWNTQY